MSIYKTVFLATVTAASCFNSASATTLTFEDLNPAPSSFDVMPASYSGFTFMNWLYGPDTTYTASSGTIDLFTDYADPNNPSANIITDNNGVTRATAFVFDGASFSGDSGVTFALYLSGALVHTSATLPDAGATSYASTFLASGYTGSVDKVVVSAVQGYYSMDDFTFHEVSSVPEPSTYALLITAFGLLTWKVRRKS